MKTFYVLVVVAVLALPTMMRADELSDLKTQLQALQKRLEALEAEKAKAAAVGISISPSSATRGTSQRLRSLRETLPKNVELWIGGAGALRLRGLPREIIRMRSAEDLQGAVARLAKAR